MGLSCNFDSPQEFAKLEIPQPGGETHAKEVFPKFKVPSCLGDSLRRQDSCPSSKSLVHPNTVRNWVDKFKGNGSEVFAKNGEVKKLKEHIRKLEQLVGQKEREIAVLKNSIRAFQVKPA